MRKIAPAVALLAVLVAAWVPFFADAASLPAAARAVESRRPALAARNSSLNAARASSCSGVTCGSHATCSGGDCYCDTGYEPQGYDCVDPCASVNCGTNAYCNAGECYCYTGYEPQGYNCVKSDPCSGIDCGANSNCNAGKCYCNTGYQPDATAKFCVKTDPCSGIDCGANSNCNAGKCYCNTGYQPDATAKFCIKTDPCSGVTCGANAYCSEGACKCYDGYVFFRSGRDCIKADLCASMDCGVNSYCNGASCSCNPGYSSPDGKNCQKIDTCDSVNCGANSNCNAGACSCITGYSSPDGRNCQKIDACASVTCGYYSTCNAGVCSCNTGYIPIDGSGKNCVPPRPPPRSTTSRSPPPPAPTTPTAPTSTFTDFAALPTSAPTLQGATAIYPRSGASLKFTDAATKGGFTCPPGIGYCILNSTQTFVVQQVSNALVLKIDGISPQFCLDANYGEPFPGPCPATYSKLSRRESNPMPMSPYWSLFNSSGSIKLMNANMGSDSGCLLVPASASGVVKLGSCSSAAAAGWSVALDSGEQSTAESSKAAPTSGGRTNVGAIAGGAVGGVLGLIAIGGLVYYFKKRGNRDNNIPVVDRDVGKSASNSYAMDSKAVAAPIMPPSPALDPQVIPDSGSFYDVGLKSAKSGTPLPTSQPIGTGSPLYFDNGGDLAAGVTAVEVRKFAVATRSWTPGAADELGLSVGDQIYVSKAFSDGWALGTRSSDGVEGLFPADCIDSANDPNASGRQTSHSFAGSPVPQN